MSYKVPIALHKIRENLGYYSIIILALFWELFHSWNGMNTIPTSREGQRSNLAWPSFVTETLRYHGVIILITSKESPGNACGPTCEVMKTVTSNKLVRFSRQILLK